MKTTDDHRSQSLQGMLTAVRETRARKHQQKLVGAAACLLLVAGAASLPFLGEDQQEQLPISSVEPEIPQKSPEIEILNDDEFIQFASQSGVAIAVLSNGRPVILPELD